MTKKAKRTTQISRQVADRFSKKLETLPDKAKESLTPKELIFENFQQLDSLLDRGYNYDDLSALMKEDGIQLSPATFRRYMGEARNVSRNPSASAKAKKNVGTSPKHKDAQPTPTASNAIQQSPEQSLPPLTAQVSNTHLPPTSSVNFNDDPELIEMAEQL